LAVLAKAEVVTFIDPKVPGWKKVVVSGKAGTKSGAKDLDVINIPVDSNDANLLQSWRERIAQARS
jgi:hypothetical protein